MLGVASTFRKTENIAETRCYLSIDGNLLTTVMAI
jgi:hypothetical protein